MSCVAFACGSLAKQCSFAPRLWCLDLVVGWCVTCLLGILTSFFSGRCLWFQQKPCLRTWKRYKKRHAGHVRICALFHVLGFLSSSLRIRQDSSFGLTVSGSTSRAMRVGEGSIPGPLQVWGLNTQGDKGAWAVFRFDFT